MKISPVSSTANVVNGAEAGTAAKIRAIKMATNVTPGLEMRELAQEATDTGTNADIIENEEKPNAAVEATEPLSPQYAALAKQRRALQQERRALEDEKKALEIAKQGGSAIDAARLKSEPLKVLMEAGVTYEQLTEAILSNPDDSKLSALEAKIAALEKGVDQKLIERDAQQKQQVLSEMRREAESLVREGDDFELVRATSSVGDVIRLIEKTYDETQEVLDVREACKLIEDELFARNQKLLQLKKMQSLVNTQAEPSAPIQQQRSGPRTLTNKDTASVPMSAKARALAAFYGTLKK